MDVITFEIPCVPIAQPRQRHRIAGGPKGQYVMNYTPSNSPVQTFKATARLACREAYKGPPLDQPLSMAVDFIFPRPRAICWKRKPTPRLPHAKKPDRDNCEKALLDALKGTLFVDDSQVCAGEVRKWVAAGDEQPRVIVSVSQVESPS